MTDDREWRVRAYYEGVPDYVLIPSAVVISATVSRQDHRIEQASAIDDGSAAWLLLEHIGRYLDMAGAQIERLQGWVDRWPTLPEAPHPERVKNGQRFAVDQHLYLVCWGVISRCTAGLALRTRRRGLRAANDVYRRYQPDLSDYARLRNHLEHVDERFPGGQRDAAFIRRDKHGVVVGMGWPDASPAHLSIDGITRDVGLESYALLCRICREMEEAVRAEVVDVMVKHHDTFPMHLVRSDGVPRP